MMLGSMARGVIRTLPEPLCRPMERELAHWSRGLEAARETELCAPRLSTAARLLLAPRLRVLCYPLNPSHWQVLYKICAVNGYRIVIDRRSPTTSRFTSPSGERATCRPTGPC